MWTAGRRLPARAAQQYAARVVAPVVAGRSAAVGHQLAPPRQHVRSFFGLKELIFGHKKQDADKATATDESAVTTTTTTIETTTDSAPVAVAPVVPAPEPQPITGSVDAITYSVGKYARLADGAVMATRGKSMVLTTAVSTPPSASGRRKDFLPLMVDYRVKYHAAGVIPDTQRRSEMTNTDEEILQSRIIDRVIRPMFPRDYCEDTQVLATVHSLDPTNDPLVLAVNATSVALALSDIPWNGPVACVRVAEVAGHLVVHPTAAQRGIATMDLLYAASETRTLMVEANGQEIPEDRMAEAMRFAHAAIAPLIKEQKQLIAQHGKPKRAYPRVHVSDEVWAKATEVGLPLVEQLFSAPRYAKVERQQGERETNQALLTTLRECFAGRDDVDDVALQVAAHDVFQKVLRDKILTGDRNSRLDGRSTLSIRGINIETDVLPMAHGSAVFSRGDTQALCSVTLGPLDRGMRIRSATSNLDEPTAYKHAILHYEFPPYCVNETGKLGGVNRRMVGHGALAEKALVPVIPSTTTFPYTVRMTSETMGSDGSSSMATVCGVCMALMDAGVPIKAPVAGISIGLVTEGDPFDGDKPINRYRLLVDILGTEDHYGDMDFKVAGTEQGITAIQLDVKLPGVPLEILTNGLQHAKKARSYLLKRMAVTLPESRKQLKTSNSTIHSSLKFFVPTSSIGALIGTGGSNIKEIEAATGCTVGIERTDGETVIVGPAENLEAAKAIIVEQITAPAPSAFYKVGQKYEMRVTEMLDFGAILESTAPTRNRGFVHITELAHQRVENIHDHLQLGQVLEFSCIQANASGKMSRKALLTPPPGMEAEASSSYNGKSSRPTSGGPRRPKTVGRAASHRRSPGGKPAHAAAAAESTSS